jgi:transposase-like protein
MAKKVIAKKAAGAKDKVKKFPNQGGVGRMAYWSEPEQLLCIEGWARDGETIEDLARKVGVVERTFYDWLNKDEGLRKAVRVGRDAADRKAENALYKRALGYEVEETKQTVTVSPTGERSQKLEKISRHIPGDVTAQIFWLKNRKPSEWRDRRDFDIQGEVGFVTIVDNVAKRAKDGSN